MTTLHPIGTGGHDRLRRQIEDHLSAGGGAPLAVLPGGVLGRDEARRETDRLLARFRAEGIGPGDRVALFCGDERRLILLVAAALRAGIAFVVGDPQSSRGEAESLVAVCRPAAVLTDVAELAGMGFEQSQPGLRVLRADAWDGQAVEDAAPRAGGGSGHPETAMLIFTSGTTSSAKAVEIGYDNLLAQLDIFAKAYGFGPGIRLLNLLPLHHTDGLTRGPISALWFGGTLVRPFPFSVQAVPRLLDRVAADAVTHLIAVPAMLRIIERVGRDRKDAFRGPDFRFVLCSADYLDAGLWSRFEEGFGVPVANAYGLSEVVCDALFAGPGDDTRIIGSIGRPVGVTAEIVDEHGAPVAPGETGELVLKGPTVMRGYFGAPGLTAEVLRDGAFRTGDLVRARPDGIHEFVGRRKTAIVSAGVTIHPEGVTAVLSTMPGLAEAYAFGQPDPDRGERLVAAVAPAPGGDLTVEQVWAFCRAHLSPERVPAEIRILDRLPRTASGKVIRSELIGAAAAPAAVQVPPASVYEVAARCLRLKPETLSRDSSPFNTPGWDSLMHLTLMTEIETAFGISFSADEVMDFVSLGDAEDIVARMRAPE
ncbi:AMP-binding protein [Paracoccus sp. YIM 132242]|uniref:AMP-binding protein n=1 Tax=Paracoccus lichenicola TaxID=2665644 RepID=A0A6L6HRG7_9RHOB|nr:AMP-binding protein [Paracoccus lichenicola]MTE01776.1 AMP-binding protein [Paracoccus lichenicola]